MGLEGVFISTKEGRLIYYRNYSSISHALFEDFAFALPSSIRVESQRTFMTHGAHRLMYLPLEELFIVMVTNLQSNIIEDIETIGNIKDVIHNILNPKISEESVNEKYCDLTFAFDDMMGMNMRNVFSRSQITSLLEMESSNEKMQKAILQSKEKEAQKRTEQESRQIEKTKKVQEILKKEFKDIDDKIKEFSGVLPKESPKKTSKNITETSVSDSSHPKEKSATKDVKGLQLKPLKKTEEKKPKEEKPKPVEPAEVEEQKFNPLADEIEVAIEEKLSGELTASGDWKKLELKGVVLLTVFNPRLDKFAVNFGSQKPAQSLGMRIPPNYDKKRWSDNVLALKDGSAGLQPNSQVESAKYGFTLPANDASLPFKLTTWFSGSEFSAEIEFNSSQNLFHGFDKLTFKFAVPDKLGITVSDYNSSEVFVEKGGFRWVVAPFNAENPTASFTLASKKPVNQEDLFPAEVLVESSTTSFKVETIKVTGAEEREIRAKLRKSMTSKELKVL